MPPSEPVRVEVDHGVATVWLAFGGTPVNALSPQRLRQLEAAWAPLVADPLVELLVIRSALPGGFCGGHDPEALASLATDEDAAAYCVAGQQILDCLASAPCVTLAFLEGPCLGPGMELALACDYRIAVAGAETELSSAPVRYGHAAFACWGGSVRGARTYRADFDSARQAAKLGLIDDAFCRRRANIELQTWINRLLDRPRKRSRPANPAALADERKAFRDYVLAPPLPKGEGAGGEGLPFVESNPSPPTPLPLRERGEQSTVAVLGHSHSNDTAAAEAALRGRRVLVLGPREGIDARLRDAAKRGRVTPLEADEAAKRVAVTADPAALREAGRVHVADWNAVEWRELRPHLRPAAAVTPPPPADARRRAAA